MAETDSEVVEEQSTESPSLGEGFLTDMTPGQSEATEEQSEEAPEEEQGETPQIEADLTKLSRDNLTDAQLRDLQGGYLRQSDYTRKTTDVSEGRAKLEADRAALLQEQKDFHSAQLEQAKAPQEQTQSQALQQLMQDPNISAEDRAGLGYIAQQAWTIEQQATALKSLQEQMEKLSPQLEETTGTVTQLTEAQNRVQVEVYKQQAAEADNFFGVGETRKYGGFIIQHLEQINPNTNEKYTIPELVGMASGKSVEEASKARQGTKKFRQRSKQQVAPTGSTSVIDTEGADQTEAQAISDIAKTMT
jgi:hypothetical protein